MTAYDWLKLEAEHARDLADGLAKWAKDFSEQGMQIEADSLTLSATRWHEHAKKIEREAEALKP